MEMIRRPSPPQYAEPHPAAMPEVVHFPAPPHDERAVLLRRMDLLRKARFEAHARLERKNFVSIMALAIFGMYGVALTQYTWLFGEELAAKPKKVLDFIGYMTSVCGIMFSLTEAMKGYSAKAAQMHDCARKVNALRHRLEIADIRTREELIRYEEAYQGILDQFPVNHEPLDFLMVQAAERARREDKQLADWGFMIWAQARYLWDVYSFYGIIIAAPFVVRWWLSGA